MSVVGRTAMIPGLPRKYRRTALTFLMSVSLARLRLDEGLSLSHSAGPLCRSTAIFQQAVDTLFARLRATLARLFHGVLISVFVSF